MDLKEILQHNYNVSDLAVTDIESSAKLLKIKRGGVIIRQGEKSTKIFFIRSGIFRVSFLKDDGEHTICFGTAGDAFCSMHAFYTGESAQFGFEAIEDSEVYALSINKFKELAEKHNDLNLWLKNLLIEQVYALEWRYVHLGTGDAFMRYEMFVKLRSDIISRIPIKYIAQYLNVRPETLSRIRAKSLRRKKQDG